MSTDAKRQIEFIYEWPENIIIKWLWGILIKYTCYYRGFTLAFHKIS
jgi:hypothetical protein